MTKHEILTNYFTKEYKKEVSKKGLKNFVYSTEEEVRKFIEKRIVFHGRNGYKFHVAEFYKLYELDIKDNKKRIVDYIVENNTFRKFYKK